MSDFAEINSGSRKLSELLINDLFEIAVIEGICFSIDFWELPVVLYFSNMMYPYTINIEFYQKKKEEDSFSRIVVFYYDFKRHLIYWHFKNDAEILQTRPLSGESIKYLWEKKYNLSIYW